MIDHREQSACRLQWLARASPSVQTRTAKYQHGFDKRKHKCALAWPVDPGIWLIPNDSSPWREVIGAVSMGCIIDAMSRVPRRPRSDSYGPCAGNVGGPQHYRAWTLCSTRWDQCRSCQARFCLSSR